MLRKAEGMINPTDTAILAVRRKAAELRPVILDELGLVAAIKWQAQQVRQRTDVRCQLRAMRAAPG